ncbi:hypothetical protein J5N97_023848 [Dioscorea zingiberensis]|uniref:BHLH domain-containing protein n=1 Tax=Dioscorea zingiberensis TaxID=325984 RepID=A0A9D5H871_9LILI|nr:hypothetical protein J5N97_023848 [Dioscorea zingiberensis]
MELDEHGFLEEFLSLKRDTWDDDFFSTEGSFAPLCFTSMDGVGMFPDPLSFDCLSEVYRPFEPVTLTDLQFSAAHGATHVPQDQSLTDTLPAVGAVGKKRKSDGAPSKNLMAERRRRKRLNDRLSLLRSVVPKISKMDRTSILADTIDYMKELLERIKQLREEMEQVGTDQSNQLNMFKDMNLNGASLRNTPNPPKFDVERRDADTRIAMCCTGKPGMLLSTLDALEALGLDIQQCVISCFNDFGMQASCSENMEKRSEMMACEAIKQVLFRSAGYSGRAV